MKRSNKFISIILGLAAVATATTGCEQFLTEESYGSTTDVFEEEAGIKSLYYLSYQKICNLYGGEWWPKMTEQGTDLFLRGNSQTNTGLADYSGLDANNGDVGSLWNHCYKALANINMFLEQIDDTPFRDESEKEQIKDEIKGVVKLIDEVYSLFGFKYHVELSTRPEDSMGSDEDWEMATDALRAALDDIGLPYVVNEGDGAFYGPKIDFHLEDSIGRTWQCGTIQLDFQLPLRFNLEYTGADGEKHRPIMIHRVVFGSIERFIGILIEHFAGAFPTWLAPVQVKVLPISDKHMEYGNKVLAALQDAGIRAEIDTRAEKIGYKIREAQMKKIPYMLVVGAKEEEEEKVSVRSRANGDEGQSGLGEFIAKIKEEIAQKK